MEGPLRLQIRGIPEGVSRLAADVAPADLDLLAADAEFVGPVAVELEVIRADEQMQFRGYARLTTRQRCARCLETIECGLSVPVEVVARRKGPRDEGQEPADGLILHNGEEIGLANEVRELILLAIPQAPVCREDCAGLCPQCGANRNVGPCRCERTGPGDPRWSELARLRETGGTGGKGGTS